MTDSSNPAGQGLTLAKLGLVLAFLCVGMLIGVALAYRNGALGVREAFGYIHWVVYGGGLAALVALAGFIQGLRSGRTSGMVMGGISLVAALLIVWIPYSNRAALRASPRLSDITTDTQNPPAFAKAAELRNAAKARNPMTYGPAKTKLQKTHYPDIKPVRLAMAPDRAFARALAAVKSFGWTLVAEDPAAGRIEAYETSLVFGFVDDVVIRIKAEGSGSRIDIRSSSRVGRRDAAVNANRVRKLAAVLSAP